jgi:nucleoid-associated protein YgaU
VAFVLLVLTSLPALVEGVRGGSTHGLGANGPEPVAAIVHVVEAGDTLWSIARQIRPDGDVRPVVDVLVEARDGMPLQPGETIVWPPESTI